MRTVALCVFFLPFLFSCHCPIASNGCPLAVQPEVRWRSGNMMKVTGHSYYDTNFVIIRHFLDSAFVSGHSDHLTTIYAVSDAVISHDSSSCLFGSDIRGQLSFAPVSIKGKVNVTNLNDLDVPQLYSSNIIFLDNTITGRLSREFSTARLGKKYSIGLGFVDFVFCQSAYLNTPGSSSLSLWLSKFPGDELTRDGAHVSPVELDSNTLLLITILYKIGMSQWGKDLLMNVQSTLQRSNSCPNQEIWLFDKKDVLGSKYLIPSDRFNVSFGGDLGVSQRLHFYKDLLIDSRKYGLYDSFELQEILIKWEENRVTYGAFLDKIVSNLQS